MNVLTCNFTLFSLDAVTVSDTSFPSERTTAQYERTVGVLVHARSRHCRQDRIFRSWEIMVVLFLFPCSSNAPEMDWQTAQGGLSRSLSESSVDLDSAASVRFSNSGLERLMSWICLVGYKQVANVGAKAKVWTDKQYPKAVWL